MRQPKEEARPQMWKSGRATHKSNESVSRNGLRGRTAEMEATEEGRRALFGWMAAIGLCALLACILIDMATGGAL